MNYEGVIPLLKPKGYTSHDVVSKARRILKMKRIGHTGTLDPMVTGVLPICVGKATRIAEYIQDRPKTYRATLRFGLSTDTEDLTGQIIQRVSPIILTEQDIHTAIQSFHGEIEQIPPMYSAVKVQGRKLYELARAGQEVERKARRVTIYHIEVNEFDLEIDEPEVTFTVECSKGTYIRTLCVDIGKALGYPAVMADLQRTATGGFALDDCISLEQLAEYVDNGTIQQYIVPLAMAIKHIPAIHIPESLATRAAQGQKVRVGAFATSESGLVRLFSETEQFIGIFRVDDDGDNRLVSALKVLI